jgi:branched-chain amino acid transport system permease protein
LTEFLQALILGLLIGGVYALLASGLTLIFGVMNVINIAQGAFLIFAAFLTWSLWESTGIDPLAAILITTPAMFLFGWLLYLTTVGRIRRAPPAATVLLTFGLALVLEGLMGEIWGNTSHSVRPAYFNESFSIGELFLPKAQVYGGLVAIVVLCGLYAILTWTWLGRAIRASAVNPQGAELVGVNVGVVATLTFAIGVASVGAGGSIASVLYPFLPGSHYQWIARLLGIIVLGGMGSLPGAVVGALLLGVAETMTVTYIGPEWATAVPYVVVIIVLLLRPQGLLGARLRQDVATA